MEGFAFAESIPQVMVILTLGSARFLGFLAVFPMSSVEFMPATVTRCKASGDCRFGDARY
jgi:hypothetical protein